MNDGPTVTVEIGRTIDNRYIVESLLGYGGMAAVYKVRHLTLGTPHAMKVLTVPGARQRLLAEGRIQGALAHPSVVPVTDVVDCDGQPGLIMEYVRGPSLEKLLERHRLTNAQIDAIALGVLDGVAAAHSAGVIHRDLKPANVLLGIAPDRLLPKVGDFGLVKIVADTGTGRSRTRSGSTMGTPGYMSPEQIRDASTVDARADVFSLGAMLYEMVTGEVPFVGDDMLAVFVAIAEGRRKPVREHSPSVPDRWVRAIDGALEIERDKRLPDVPALRAIWFEGHVPRLDVWPGPVLDLCASLGGGGATTELIASMTSDPPRVDRKPTPVAPPHKPSPQVVQSAPTLGPDGAPSAAPTLAPDIHSEATGTASTKLNASATFNSSDPVDRPTTPVVTVMIPGPPPMSPPGPATVAEAKAFQPSRAPLFAVGGVVALLCLVVAAVALAVVVGGVFNGGTVAEADPPVDIPPHVDVPIEAHVDPPVEPIGTADPVETPTTKPVDKPVKPVDKPVDKPVVVDPPVEPIGTADPVDTPVDTPATVPDTTPARVTIESDVTVILRDKDGRSANAASLEPGTYTVVAFFKDGVPSEVKSLTLGPGAHVSVKCVASRAICRVDPQ